MPEWQAVVRKRKENIRSFARTQLEAAQKFSNSPEFVENEFLNSLTDPDDLEHLEATLDINRNLNDYVKAYYKKAKIDRDLMIGSVVDVKSRDNSYVLVRQSIDQTPKSRTTNMVVKSFYYRINYFFEFQFGQTICVLANANELLTNSHQHLDLIGML